MIFKANVPVGLHSSDCRDFKVLGNLECGYRYHPHSLLRVKVHSCMHLIIVLCMDTSKLVPGLVNVDFADVLAIMKKASSFLMGIGTATGKSKARDAALNAIQSLLLDIGFEQATGIVWKITGGSSLALFELSLPTSPLKVSITLIATGFNCQDESEGKGAQHGLGDASVRINRDISNANVEA
ncbi:cell division protein FtsZ homolog 2-2, chloroplastic-like [Hevea brasiliensis]|uniref:cell division protein FtsZ homolog 2-2, chloroplastic-like n=1 Tax=Hevea brasiliensis TaxID=3981 RepID=UPI0025D38EDC|nr:cell division protein FtsZ homolog 2-2, chloroplastic-like [Hevea brasiliensis]